MFDRSTLIGAVVLACFFMPNVSLADSDAKASPVAEKELSKKERKALRKKLAKSGKMSAMCISSLAMQTFKDESIKETPKYLETKTFWTEKLDDVVVKSVKEKKRAKLRATYVQEGADAMKGMDSNIFVAGQKTGVICNLIQSEGFDGPTSKMMLSE